MVHQNVKLCTVERKYHHYIPCSKLLEWHFNNNMSFYDEYLLRRILFEKLVERISLFNPLRQVRGKL